MRLHDTRMRRRHRAVTNQELFVELLAGPQSGHLEFDIAIRRMFVTDRAPRKLHQPTGEVDDPHRLAHVEHEDIAPMRHRACLNHQLGGLGNGHEIARDVRMRQRDRATRLDLLSKQRHHRTARAQHVPEADHREAGVRTLLRQPLQRHFGDALAGPHDVRRPHGLVGADQDKVGNLALHRNPRRRERAHRVVSHTLCRVVLDERHMLVRRRVIDRIRVPGAHHFTQPRSIAYRGEQWDDTYVRRQLLQLLVDAIERVFAQLYE
ncbi:hypothetical protein D3C71_1340370 [compost metagenome]